MPVLLSLQALFLGVQPSECPDRSVALSGCLLLRVWEALALEMSQCSRSHTGFK